MNYPPGGNFPPGGGDPYGGYGRPGQTVPGGPPTELQQPAPGQGGPARTMIDTPVVPDPAAMPPPGAPPGPGAFPQPGPQPYQQPPIGGPIGYAPPATGLPKRRGSGVGLLLGVGFLGLLMVGGAGVTVWLVRSQADTDSDAPIETFAPATTLEPIGGDTATGEAIATPPPTEATAESPPATETVAPPATAANPPATSTGTTAKPPATSTGTGTTTAKPPSTSPPTATGTTTTPPGGRPPGGTPPGSTATSTATGTSTTTSPPKIIVPPGGLKIPKIQRK